MWKVRNNMQITKEDAVLARQGREILYAQRLKGLAQKKRGWFLAPEKTRKSSYRLKPSKY